jgi:hypothetical protein
MDLGNITSEAKRRSIPQIHASLMMQILREDIHIDDTLGRAYRVKHARKLLREYQRIYKNEINQWKEL